VSASYLLEIFVSEFQPGETGPIADLHQQVVQRHCPSSWPTGFFNAVDNDFSILHNSDSYRDAF
jgi:hypothetical protein